MGGERNKNCLQSFILNCNLILFHYITICSCGVVLYCDVRGVVWFLQSSYLNKQTIADVVEGTYGGNLAISSKVDHDAVGL